MKKIKANGKDYEIRNEGKEVTLNELSKIAFIFNGKEGDFTDKWLKVIEVLSCKELIEVITLKQFTELVQSIQITNIKKKIKKTITVKGRDYSLNMDGKEIALLAKDLRKIESLISDKIPWGHKAFALIYKDVNLSDNEHYTDAHIKYKADLFGDEVNADIAAPVIFSLSKLIIEHIQALSDAQSVAV